MKFMVKVTRSNITIDGEIDPNVVRLLVWMLIYVLLALGLLSLPEMHAVTSLLPR